MRVDQWQNEAGEYRSKTYVLASNIEYLSSKTSEKAPEKTDGEILRDVMEDKDPYEVFGEQIEIKDSDLPF